MTNTKENALINYEVNGKEVKLSPTMVKKYLVNGNGNVSDQEVVNFMQLCRYQQLNPFLNEAYLVKFGKSPAQIIVSKEAFMKRAENNKHYKGFKAGIVVARGDVMKHLDGALKMPKDTLIGAWADVYRNDREKPIHVEISLDEFSKGQSTWKQMPMNMIRKTALVNALREAFPESLGAMYTEDDHKPVKDINAEVVNEENNDQDSTQTSDVFGQSIEKAQDAETVETENESEKEEKSAKPEQENRDENKQEDNNEQEIDVDQLMKDLKANNGTKKEDNNNGKQESLFEGNTINPK